MTGALEIEPFDTGLSDWAREACRQIDAAARMTGFWATLSEEQKQRALFYRGPDGHGDDEFRRR